MSDQQPTPASLASGPDETEHAVARLDRFALRRSGSADGAAAGIVVSALRAALSENERLRRDAERLDWLESLGQLSIYVVGSRDQWNTGLLSLRSTIDDEIGTARAASGERAND